MTRWTPYGRAGKISPDLSSMRFTRNGSREYRKADTAATDMETMHMETAGRVMRKVQKREVEHMAEHKKDIEIKEQNDEVEIDLGRLIQSMWKSFRKLWWLVLALVTAGAAVFTVYQRFYNKPLYACTATFTVGTGDESSGSYSFYYDSTTADQMSKTFPYILESSFFRNTLLEQLGTDTLNGTITAETIEDSNVVTMRAESPSAEDARAILDTAIAVYPDTARFVLGDIQFNMLDEPSTPTEPFNQMGIKRSVAFGGLGGLVLSVCILGVLALFRQTARDQDEMKRDHQSSLSCGCASGQVKSPQEPEAAEDICVR